MAGLVPAIHVFFKKDVDARHKAGHDERKLNRNPEIAGEYPMADNDDIPFNRDFPLKPGVVDEVRPGVRRILCNNPSPFTFTGTVSYIVGRGNVAIIDPGPDDEAHAAALLGAVRN